MSAAHPCPIKLLFIYISNITFVREKFSVHCKLCILDPHSTIKSCLTTMCLVYVPCMWCGVCFTLCCITNLIDAKNECREDSQCAGIERNYCNILLNTPVSEMALDGEGAEFRCFYSGDSSSGPVGPSGTWQCAL